MRANPDNEKLHITQIAEGLEKLKALIYDANDDPINVEVTALVAAVAAYASIHNGVLPIFYDSDRLKECCHYVASAMDLVRYIQQIAPKSKIGRIKNHLKLIGQGGFGIYATYHKQQHNESFLYNEIGKIVSQTPNKEKARDAARKSIELMLALASLNKFDDVILEDPNHSSDTNPNPDLIIADGEERYGIACKSISSKNRNNFEEHVRTAIHQLKKATKMKRVDSGRGIVFVDVSSLLNHNKLFVPAVNQYWDCHSALIAIQSEISRVMVDLLGESKVHKKMNHLFKKSQVAPCIVIYAHSLMIARKEFGIFPHYYKPMRVLPCGDHSKVAKFLNELNNANHCQ